MQPEQGCEMSWGSSGAWLGNIAMNVRVLCSQCTCWSNHKTHRLPLSAGPLVFTPCVAKGGKPLSHGGRCGSKQPADFVRLERLASQTQEVRGLSRGRGVKLGKRFAGPGWIAARI